jgi:hypothetical protein
MSVWQNATTLAASGISPGTYMTGASDNLVHTVYADSGSVFYLRSTDSGQTFSKRLLVTGTGIDLPFDESIICNHKNVFICYVINNDSGSSPAQLWMIISRDGGITWEAPIEVDDGVTGFSTGNNKFYRHSMFMQGSYVYHCWVSTDNTVFSTQGLNYRYSSDFGRTWSTTILINSSTIDSPGRPAMVVGGNKVHVTFTDIRSGTTFGNTGETYYVSSDDNGVTWNTEVALSATAAHKTLRPDIVVNGQNICIVWQDQATGNNVLYTILSSDNGLTWGSINTITSSSDAIDHATFDAVGGVLRLYYSIAAGGLGVGTNQIGVIESLDNGSTWGTQQIINITGNAQVSCVPTHSDRFWIITYFDGSSPAILQSRNYRGLPPTVPILDSFTRADENPVSDSSRWVLGAVTSGLTTLPKLVSNSIRRQLGSGSFGRDGAHRQEVAIPSNADCAVRYKLSQASTDGEIDLILGNPVTNQGYSLVVAMGGFGTAIHLNSSSTANIASAVTYTPAGGEILLLWIDGADISSWMDSGSGLVELQRALNTSFRTGLFPGIEIAGFSDTTTATADDFGAVIITPNNSPLDFSQFPKFAPVANS